MLFRRLWQHGVLSLIMPIALVGVGLTTSAHPASAAAWPQDITATALDTVVTHANGAVTLVSCTTTSYAARTNALQTLDANGARITTVVNQMSSGVQTSGCANDEVVNASGTTFVYRGTGTGSNQYIVAYKNNAELWRRQTVGSCDNKVITPQARVVGVDGNLYLLYRYSCSSGNKVELVSLSATNGAVRFRKMISTNVYDAIGLKAYTGGVIFSTNAGSSISFRYFNTNGVENVAKIYEPALSTGEFVSSFGVDHTGKIFVGIVQHNVLVATSYSKQGDSRNYAFAELLLYSSSGERLASYRPTVATGQYFKMPSNVPVGLSQGYLYLAQCHGPSCTYNTETQTLHKVPFAEVSIDYPRGALMGVSATVAGTVNYVAMGDSFSSGHVANAPGCRRDNDTSYPALLADDPTLKWRLTKFVACSGATTQNITTENRANEPPQMQVLATDTNIVTFTIGGNDVPFKNFVEACVYPDLSLQYGCASQPKVNALASINTNVGPNLDAMLGAIKSRLQTLGSNAKVFVIGYPQLVPAQWSEVIEPQCAWLSDAERIAIREVTDTLNAKIRDAVATIDPSGSRFTFVSATNTDSPFKGHELCTGSSYFYNIDAALTDSALVAHPTLSGRSAFAELIRRYVTG